MDDPCNERPRWSIRLGGQQPFCGLAVDSPYLQILLAGIVP